MTGDVKLALPVSDFCIINYDADSEAGKVGIKKIGVKYEFEKNKLSVTPKVAGRRWRVKFVKLWDMTQYFKDRMPSEDELSQAMNDELDGDNPYWACEVKKQKPPYTCEVRSDFGGGAMMFVVGVAKLKAPLVQAMFPFWVKLFPTVTFFMGFGDTFCITRYLGDFRVIEVFNIIRLPNGQWIECGDVFAAKKKLGPEDLKALAMLDCLSLVKQMFKAEEKIGKAYMDGIFDKMEKEGRVAEGRIFSPFALWLLGGTYRFYKFILPSPYENFMEATRQFEIFLNPKSTWPEKVAGFLGFIGYGSFVILDFVPGEKALRKADDVVAAIRGAKRLKKVEDAVEHTEKLIVAAEKGWDEAFERVGKVKRANPELAPSLEEGLRRIQRAKEEGEKARKALTENFSSLARDEQVRLFQKAQASQDLREVIKFASQTNNPYSLKQICAATKGWSPRRRWKAIVDWVAIQKMRGKSIQKVKFSDEANRLVQEGEALTNKAYLNLTQDGFKAAAKKIEKGLEKIGGKGLLRKDIDKFKDALEKAYRRLSPEQRKYIEGIEFSGKSATGFSDEAVKYLNDIDCTIMPITPKGLADRRARKQFFQYVEQEFGTPLKDKNIFIYPEWGKGAFNKADEGWPPKLRHVYEKVENKALAHFGETGSLSKLAVRNADVIGRLPTKEEAAFFVRWALKEFMKSKNPKWIHKVDKVLEAAGIAKKYSKGDREIIEKMRGIYIRPANEIKAGEEMLVEEATNFLRKYGGDPDAALNPIRYIFMFKSKYEAARAYAYVKPLQMIQRLIRILYVEDIPETSQGPAMKVIRVYQEPPPQAK